MGAGQKRRIRFIAEHPICYFCCGPSSTIDHVPSRECFIDRQWPEGYEFPACERCNREASGLEQVIALYRHGADHELDPRSESHVRKLMSGVINNQPHMLPYAISANKKRRAAKNFGIEPTAGSTFSHLPIVGIPLSLNTAFRLFIRRLTAALFYKHFGRPLPLTNKIRTERLLYRDVRASEIVPKLVEHAPILTRTARQNTTIGDQFVYNWGGNDEEDFFHFVAQFAKAFYVIGQTASVSTQTAGEDWVSHLDDLKSN